MSKETAICRAHSNRIKHPASCSLGSMYEKLAIRMAHNSHKVSNYMKTCNQNTICLNTYSKRAQKEVKYGQRTCIRTEVVTIDELYFNCRGSWMEVGVVFNKIFTLTLA